MPFRGCKLLPAASLAATLIFLARPASAATTITLLGDSGALRVTTYSPSLQVASSNLGPVYGTSPLPPVVTTSSGGVVTWKVTFTPSSQFFATASNSAGGTTMETDGNLDFIVNFDSPVPLNVDVLEDGVWNTTGGGSKNLTGGITVTNLGTSTVGGNSFGFTAFASPGFWTLSDFLSGPIGSPSSSYKISISNTLLAEPLVSSPPGSSSYIATKDITIIFTGFAPEPSSLALLASGSVFLLLCHKRPA
jgi:hypothetical protein